MPRKQRFKPSRKPKPQVEETIPAGTQVSRPAQPPTEREETRVERDDVVIDHERPR